MSSSRTARAAAALLAAAAALTATPAAAVTGPWQENPESRVRLVSPYAEAPATGPWRLGLEFETEPGWHVYWKNSGDAGYPPVIDFAATPGAGAAEIGWPAPERYLLPGDLEALGYEGRVVYPLELAIEPAGDAVAVAADLDYLVCEVDCIPYRYRLTLAQPVAAGGAAVPDAAAAADLDAWRARLPRPAAEAGVETAAAVDLAAPGGPVLEVRVSGARALAGAEADLFLEADERFDFGVPERVATDDGAILFRVPAPFWQVPDPMPAAVELGWTVTGLAGDRDPHHGGAPLAVEARREVPIGEGGLAAATSTAARPPAARLLLLLAGALAGGLLLHLTPTVLPLTLGRALDVAAAPDGAAGRRAALATAGGALAGGLALGAVALAAQAAGRPVTWGTQLQEPPAVALLALAATLLALHLWGLFGWPLAVAGGAATPTAERAGTATTRGAAVGLATALLALPWSLPPLPESLGPALAAGPAAGLAASAALGAGLALPWAAMAAAPRRVARLLAPWAAPARARRLAEGLGFLAVGSVVWLLYLLSRQLRTDGLASLQLLLLVLALVAWVRATARRRLLAAALAVVLAVLAVATVWIADARRVVPRAGADAAAVADARPASAPTHHSSP